MVHRVSNNSHNFLFNGTFFDWGVMQSFIFVVCMNCRSWCIVSPKLILWCSLVATHNYNLLLSVTWTSMSLLSSFASRLEWAAVVRSCENNLWRSNGNVVTSESSPQHIHSDSAKHIIPCLKKRSQEMSPTTLKHFGHCGGHWFGYTSFMSIRKSRLCSIIDFVSGGDCDNELVMKQSQT